MQTKIKEFLLGGDRIDHLKWWDLVILAVIFFGYSTYISTVGFLALEDPILGDLTPKEFSTNDNYEAFFDQLFFFVIAAVYLILRRFNFRQWTIRITLKSTFAAIVIFVGVALLFDAYHSIVALFIQPFESAIEAAEASEVIGQSNLEALLAKIDLSLVLFSLQNGFYEEIFFLGICLSVAPKYRVAAFIFSLVVRTVFHTYQGLSSALAIGLILGIAFYFLYTRSKDKNLYPFFLAHAICDVVGLAILYLFGI